MDSNVPVVFPRVRPGDDIVVSATTFVSYERCPEQALGRLRGVYGPESRRSFTGGLAVFQLTNKGLMAQADISGTKYWKAKKLNRR